MPDKPTRAVLYLRTSTKRSGNEGQTPENQRIKLLEFARAMSWEIVDEYVDQESGAKSDRPRFKAMMSAASRREFDTILVWSLDRFSREGIGKTCGYLRQLANVRVAFKSLQEPFLDTTGDFAELVAAIFAFFASFERKRTIERIKAAHDRARAQGKHVGRPRLVVDRSKVQKLRQQGLSVRAVAAKMKISAASVHRIAQSI